MTIQSDSQKKIFSTVDFMGDDTLYSNAFENSLQNTIKTDNFKIL